MLRPALLFVIAAASPLSAQPRGAAAEAVPSRNADMRQTWTEVSAFLARSAAAVPDSSYAYKPVATVRSFGELIAHVAGSQRMFCAASLGEPGPREDEIEKSMTSKADLVKALDASNKYCARAYLLPSARLTGTVEFFGKQHSKESVLLMNITHDYEHYGNVVTYMRMLGMVPPSSQPTP